jgi:hypothetical protein
MFSNDRGNSGQEICAGAGYLYTLRGLVILSVCCFVSRSSRREDLSSWLSSIL